MNQEQILDQIFISFTIDEKNKIIFNYGSDNPDKFQNILSIINNTRNIKNIHGFNFAIGDKNDSCKVEIPWDFPIKENNYTTGDIEIQYDYKNIYYYYLF